MLTAGRLSCKVLVPNFAGNSTFVVVLHGNGSDMVPGPEMALANLLQPRPNRIARWPTISRVASRPMRRGLRIIGRYAGAWRRGLARDGQGAVARVAFLTRAPKLLLVACCTQEENAGEVDHPSRPSRRKSFIRTRCSMAGWLTPTSQPVNSLADLLHPDVPAQDSERLRHGFVRATRR
jgi:hypothetical protein